MSGTMIDHLIETARLGIEMRTKQKAYFKTRTRDDLIASKEAESAFDKAAAALMAQTEATERLMLDLIRPTTTKEQN